MAHEPTPPAVPTAQRMALWTIVSACRWWYRFRYRIDVHGETFHARSSTTLFTNHRSMLDSFLFGSLLYGHCARRSPGLLPWNVPKKKRWTTLWPVAPILRICRTVPVAIGANNQPRDPRALHTIVRLLQAGNVVHLFPEGTRGSGDVMLPLTHTACAVPIIARSSIQLAYYRRVGRIRSIRIGPCFSPDDVEALAGTGTIKIRSERLAVALHSVFASLIAEAIKHDTA